VSRIPPHPDVKALVPYRPSPIWLPWCGLRLHLYTYPHAPRPWAVTVHWIAEERWWALLYRPDPLRDLVWLWADRDGDGVPDHYEEISSWGQWWTRHWDFCRLPAYLGVTPPQSVRAEP